MNYGRYQTMKEIGRGSMGVVYQCRDPHIDRLVAVKVLRMDRVENDNFVQRFLKEAKVIGRLTHPNIVTIYDVGEQQGTVYIAMELLEGNSLSDTVRGTPLSTKEVVALGVQLAEALDYAHQKGVVHRDMKPCNIVVQAGGSIKITDFGIAHVEDAAATLRTQAGEIIGTPAYMSPEQVLSQPVDGRTDIFSLGIILYELTTGKRPFGGESKSLATVFKDILEVTPREPADLVPALPQGISRLIMKALEKDPAKRFQTGKELAEALRACLASPAAEPAQATAAAAQSSKRSKQYALVAGGLTTVALLGGGIYFFSSRPATPAAPIAKPVPSASSLTHPATSTPKLSEAAAPEHKHDKPVQHTAKEPAKATVARKSTAASSAAVQPSPAARMPLEDTAVVEKPSQKYAFLKIGSSPPGARICINGSQKGTTPMIMKLSLGQYQVRLTRPGYQEVERLVSLENVQEYPVSETLRPAE